MTPRSGAALLTAAWLALSGARVPAQIPTCPGTGPAMTVLGGRFGDAWSLTLAGPPNAPALIGIDPLSGSSPTPLGTVCLGLSSSLLLIPAMLDSVGHMSVAGALPIAPPGLAGSTLSLQAAVAHSSYPSGFALTNGSVVTFRPPRIAAFQGSSFSSSTGVLGGSITEIDAVTDTIVPSVAQPLVGPLPVRIPKLGWFAAQTPGGLSCFDDFTGAPTQYFPGALPGVFGYLGPGFMDVQSSSDGSRLVAAQSYYAPHIVEFSLPSGAATSSFTLPPTFPFNPLRWIRLIEGTPFTYVGTVLQIYVIDGSTGSVVTTVPLPGSIAWPPFVDGQFLYAHTTGAGLIAIDGTTHSVVLGPTPIVSFNPQPVALGPGPTGTSLYVVSGDLAAGAGLTLTSIDVATFTVTGNLTLPGWVMSMHPTAGGTAWLANIYDPASQNPDLYVIDAVTLQASLFLSGVSGVAVLRSETLRKAYARIGSDIVGFPTDPVTSPGPTIPIGIGALVSN